MYICRVHHLIHRMTSTTKRKKRTYPCTTRNLLTSDPPYWSLDGHYFPFMTFLWPKTVGHQWSVTNGLYDHIFGVDHKRLWPNLMVVDSMTKILVTRSLARPHQIQRGQSYVANFMTKSNGLNLNSAQFFTWAEPNNQAYLTNCFQSILVSYIGQPFKFFGP
jgi:hypothetical protein